MRFYLCKAVLHRPSGAVHKLDNLNDAANQAVLAKIIEGEYAALPDGTIVEPIEQFPTEAAAQDERDVRMSTDKRTDYRVIGVL